MIIFIASIITRILGFIFRVYIADKLGAQGMGLYQLVTSLYMLIASFCTSGITIAVSKMVAEQLAANKYGSLTAILRISVSWSLFISISVLIIVFSFAPFIGSTILSDERTILSLRLIAPSLPFMAVSSSIKGYYFALRNSIKPSSATVIEQVAKMIFIMAIIGMWLPYGFVYATAAASLGMTIGEIVGASYMMLTYFLDKNNSCHKKGKKRKILKDIISISFPIQTSSTLHSSLRLAENILIISSLKIFSGGDGNTAIGIYGVLKGMVLPLLMFPTSLLQGGITVLIPEMAGANACGNKKTIKRAVSRTFQITLLVGIFISLVFVAFSNQIASLLFKDPLAPPLLFKLSFLCPLIYIEMVSTGILNGIGEQLSPMVYSILDSVLRLLLIFLFVPHGGINAFLWIMVFSNLFTSTLNFYRLLKVSELRPNIFEWFIKPLICAILTIFPAIFINRTLVSFVSPLLSLILSIGCCFIIDLTLLICVGSINKDDIKYFTDCIKKKPKKNQ